MATISSHGTQIYYEVHGRGDKTLVFAHGMGGNAASWFNQIAAFHTNFKLIAFDHRYFGRSACDQSAFNPAWFADDILAILDAEAVERAVFVCQSMGGWTGSQVALHHSNRIDGLLMSHTPGVFYHPDVVNDASRVEDLVTGLGVGAFDSPALGQDYPKLNPAGAVLYAALSSFNNIDHAVIPRSIAAAKLGVNVETLGDYAVPTTFVTGDQDILFPAAYIEALSKHVPGAKCVNLGKVGHSSYFETPGVFNEVCKSFLAEVGY